MFGPHPDNDPRERDVDFAHHAAAFLIHAGIKDTDLRKRTKDAPDGFFYIGYNGITEAIICNPIQWGDILTNLQKHYHPSWFKKDVIPMNKDKGT